MTNTLVWFNVGFCAVLAVPTLIAAVVASRRKTEGGRAIAAFCACVLGGLVVTAIASPIMRGRYRAAREGWELRPVIVASDEIPAGTMVTYDVLQQRALPEQFVVDSDVTPDRASEIVGRPTVAKLLAGDIVTWASAGVGLAQTACPRLQR